METLPVSSDSTRPGLSSRGRRLIENPPMAGYYTEHVARCDLPVTVTDDEDRYIGLCVAENKLVWDLLRPKMLESRDVPERVLGYDTWVGSRDFRRQLAEFMGRTFLGRLVDPNHVMVTAGAGAALELLFYAIADPGDGVLVPTPSYAGFWADLETRDEVAIVPVHCVSSEGFALTEERLDAALAAADRPVKALLFTTPNNPIGTVSSAAEVDRVLAWAEQKGIHVVFDELYALSVFGGAPFVSAASRATNLGDTVHVVWAFSKDFAASGLRCGVLMSENPEVIRAVETLAYWACCSGDTQFMLGEMISDDEWVDGYVAEMQSRLGEAHRRTSDALDDAGIGYLPAEAGFFVLCDMRPFMSAPTWEDEERLWRRILDEANVNLTPGAACRVGEPGFMRLCFAAEPTDVVVEGIRRLATVLR
jgi:aspartate/methionine/tyrosine aminotransferase